MVFAREIGPLPGDVPIVWWADEPCCLVQGFFNRGVELVRESTAHQESARLRCSASPELGPYTSGPRLLGKAAPRAGDGLVIVHEHLAGVRMVTSRGQGIVGERIWRQDLFNICLVTDGRRIIVRDPYGTTLRCHDSWWLDAPPTSWSLEPLRRATDPAQMFVVDLLDLGDSLLISTPDTYSRWSWDGALLERWPGPPKESMAPHLVAWHPDGPVLYKTIFDPATGRWTCGRNGWHLVIWDLKREEERSLGPSYDWPRGARSADGRWLVVDRVAQGGRGLELWDLSTGTLVERLPTRRHPVRALAFAPDNLHIAVASGTEFFVLRIVA